MYQTWDGDWKITPEKNCPDCGAWHVRLEDFVARDKHVDAVLQRQARQSRECAERRAQSK